MHIKLFQFYSYFTLHIHICSPYCLLSFLSVKPGRFSCSSAQPLYIIKTPPQHIILKLGSTWNLYFLSITQSCISCNCPNWFQSCKHILYLVATCGFLPHRVSHLSLSHRSILQQLHAVTLSPRLEASLLDKHTTAKMHSVHKYPRFFFCATQPTLQWNRKPFLSKPEYCTHAIPNVQCTYILNWFISISEPLRMKRCCGKSPPSLSS